MKEPFWPNYRLQSALSFWNLSLSSSWERQIEMADVKEKEGGGHWHRCNTFVKCYQSHKGAPLILFSIFDLWQSCLPSEENCVIVGTWVNGMPSDWLSSSVSSPFINNGEFFWFDFISLWNFCERFGFCMNSVNISPRPPGQRNGGTGSSPWESLLIQDFLIQPDECHPL